MMHDKFRTMCYLRGGPRYRSAIFHSVLPDEHPFDIALTEKVCPLLGLWTIYGLIPQGQGWSHRAAEQVTDELLREQGVFRA